MPKNLKEASGNAGASFVVSAYVLESLVDSLALPPYSSFVNDGNGLESWW